VQVLEKVSISLSDCLAGSGCITSAESVLVSQQGPDELIRILKTNRSAKVILHSILAQRLKDLDI